MQTQFEFVLSGHLGLPWYVCWWDGRKLKAWTADFREYLHWDGKGGK